MAEFTDDVAVDYYAILGLDSDATGQDIKKAFRKIARECHPDIAGEDAAAAERFKEARKAYEQLVDPVKRARYDRRKSPSSRNPFFDFWMGREPEPEPKTRNHRGNPANNLDLDDIFNDFGGWADFGFGQGRNTANKERERPRAPQDPAPGRDIHIQVSVPTGIAMAGGTVTVRYKRLRRSDTGNTLSGYDEIYDLRVPPNTYHGDTLRSPRMGDAGTGGGPYGDLVCDIVIVGSRPHHDEAKAGTGADEQRDPHQRRPSLSNPLFQDADGSKGHPLPLIISVTEALLGGRVEVDTPTGRVRLVVPPCTSSGRMFRLRHRGMDHDGSPADLYFCAQILSPRSLDEESRSLIEEFAQLNPHDPRS